MNPDTPGLPSLQDIRPLRGPLPIPDEASWWPWLLVIVTGIAFGVAALWYFKGRCRGRSAAVRLAHEVALSALERARQVARPERSRTFAIRVDGALRRYLTDRCGLPLVRRTTAELLRDLRTAPHGVLDREDIAAVAAILDTCDAAKFAGAALSEARIESVLDEAIQLIDRTRYRPEETDEDEATEAAATGAPAKEALA